MCNKALIFLVKVIAWNCRLHMYVITFWVVDLMDPAQLKRNLWKYVYYLALNFNMH